MTVCPPVGKRIQYVPLLKNSKQKRLARGERLFGFRIVAETLGLALRGVQAEPFSPNIRNRRKALGCGCMRRAKEGATGLET
jgi:hypothetical protein